MENIKILVLDVDGTLTDGKLYMDDKDNALKAFNVRDGFAIVNWLKLGGEVAIITGKSSNIVERRAKELGIKYVVQDSKNKTQDLKKILERLNLSFENVAYMGDDLNDIGLMKKILLPACKHYSVLEVREIFRIIYDKNGVEGDVRDLLEHIMKANGMWKKVLDRYLTEQ